MKIKSCILRLSEHDNTVLDAKASLLNTTKSALLRDGGMHYWNNNGSTNSNQPYDAEKLLKLYQSSDDKKLVVEIVFQYLRRHGYPHNVLDRSTLIKKMHTIANSKSPLLEDDHLQINTTGLQVPNHFHNHMVKVRCLDRYISPQECFDDDDRLRDAINRWMELDKKPTLAGMRRILRTRDKVRSVVNWKPSLSRFFYDTYAAENSSCLDMCMGFGGRMCGLIACNKNLLYHGIDVDSETCTSNARLAGFYYELYNNDIEKERMWKFKFKMDLGCSEDVMPTLPSENYELIFSSPPFFSQEKYSLNPGQSYLKYPEYEIWREKFLLVIVKESFRVCKKSGYLILNLKDYKKYPIASDALKFAESIGFRLVRTYQQRLSNSEYHRQEGSLNYHTEPIFVWQKD